METVFSVSELTEIIKQNIESAFYSLVLEGEVSGFKAAPTGHWYFSLKDQGAVISATMWRNTALRMNFIPRDGDRVVVTGSVGVYAPRGTYSFNCTSMRKCGDGDILAKLEERKKYYAEKGWFDEKFKKQIPLRPSKVAVITSPTGAALQDILQITGRRAGGMDIIILPALVQGEAAAKTVAARIKQVNQFGLADVMIVGRGGGSIEDLLPFSEDCVIEAIHESQIPVISAVGHEIDWALSDFVADLRAPTPSAAAELVCENQMDRLAMVRDLMTSMTEDVLAKVNNIKSAMASFNSTAMLMAVQNRIYTKRMALDCAVTQMQGVVNNRVSACRTALDVVMGKIQALSPKAVLDRGFAIVTDSEGHTLRKISQTSVGNNIKITVSDGKIGAKVLEVQDE